MDNKSVLLNGYDLPVYGFDDGMFYILHIPTIVCITVSLLCAAVAIIVSFRRHSGKSFYSWTKCDRLIVYLAICDGLFNLSHGSDHLHMTISKNHVYPKELCYFYGFMTSVFVSAQNLLVAIIAINIFALMYFDKRPGFGRYDWILLLVTFGSPLVVSVVVLCLGKLGPNGIFCYTDGVKGWTAYVWTFTVPLLVILIMNSSLYLLCWLKIRSEVRQIRTSLGQDIPNKKTSLRAAKSMSMFVAAFFIQWCVPGIYGAWELFGNVPVIFLHIVTKFPNIGGVLNLAVFYIVSKERRTGQTSRIRTQNRLSTTVDKGLDKSTSDLQSNIETRSTEVSSIS